MWFIRRMGLASRRFARHPKQCRGLLRSMVARLTTPAKLSAEGDALHYAGEGADYFRVVKGADGRVTAVEFLTDGMAPPRTEKRAKDST